ncbi:MAG: MauE/DoxX family redox-associated membrane protein [Jatrophihabitans sp.]|uniref:MauE/DoxX family redox-associated membrane protein n=1 Tax=Jatrophihabitans sp. TaxID=1932789 RepID=UPI003F7EB096
MITTVHLVALSAAVLLLPSGLAKIAAPRPALTMLRGLRVLALRPVLGPTTGPALVRLVGVVEVAVAAAVVTLGGRTPAVALAVLYAAFVGVVGLAILRHSSASCGCFGATDAPIGRGHLGVDLVALAAAIATAVHPAGALGGLTGLPTGHGIVAAAQVLVLTALGYLCITALPALAAARRVLVGSTKES